MHRNITGEELKSTNIWSLQSIESKEFYDVEQKFCQHWIERKGRVQEKQQKKYPDWKASLFEVMEASCCVAEIKGREDF